MPKSDIVESATIKRLEPASLASASVPLELIEDVNMEKCFSELGWRRGNEDRNPMYILSLKAKTGQSYHLAVIPDRVFKVFSCEKYCGSYTLLPSEENGTHQTTLFKEIGGHCATLMNRIAIFLAEQK